MNGRKARQIRQTHLAAARVLLGWTKEAFGYYRGLGMSPPEIWSDPELWVEYIRATYGQARGDKVMAALGDVRSEDVLSALMVAALEDAA